MRITQEPDQVNPRVIVTVAVLATLVTAGGSWAAWLLQGYSERAIGVSASESVVARWGHAPEERNAVEMSLFGPRAAPTREMAAHGAPPRSAGDGALERLRGYGWSDRERSRVHIPIDRAMLLYLGKARGTPLAPSSPGGAPLPPRSPGSAP